MYAIQKISLFLCEQFGKDFEQNPCMSLVKPAECFFLWLLIRRVKKDFGPYLEALDKITEHKLQYVIARTGVQLGVDQPLSVARARESMVNSERKAKGALDKKILRRLQHGVYAKRVEKFLSST